MIPPGGIISEFEAKTNFSICLPGETIKASELDKVINFLLGSRKQADRSVWCFMLHLPEFGHSSKSSDTTTTNQAKQISCKFGAKILANLGQPVFGGF